MTDISTRIFSRICSTLRNELRSPARKITVNSKRGLQKALFSYTICHKLAKNYTGTGVSTRIISRICSGLRNELCSPARKITVNSIRGLQKALLYYTICHKLAKNYTGTGVSTRIFSRICSGLRNVFCPAARIILCESTAGARYFTSSGVAKARLFINASA